MRVHHLNCGTMCPPSRLVGRLVCHCLAIETNSGIVLVETGIGESDIAARRQRLGLPFVFVTGPRLDPAETMVAQLRARGIQRDDVRHILLTHLDVDHAGGVSDFPRAKVHVHPLELHGATARPSGNERMRYKPAQWAHGPDWAPLPVGGERWNGFDGVKRVPGLEPEILVVPLFGHSRGHSGVAVREADGWLLHAGDAYFAHEELAPQPRCPPGLQLFQWVVQIDGPARLANQARLRALANDTRAGVRIICSHDARELEAEIRRERAPRAAGVPGAEEEAAAAIVGRVPAQL